MGQFSRRADRFIQRLFGRPLPKAPEPQQTATDSVLRTLRKRREELTRTRGKI